jgi:hypothetical protein
VTEAVATTRWQQRAAQNTTDQLSRRDGGEEGATRRDRKKKDTRRGDINAHTTRDDYKETSSNVEQSQTRRTPRETISDRVCPCPLRLVSTLRFDCEPCQITRLNILSSCTSSNTRPSLPHPTTKNTPRLSILGAKPTKRLKNLTEITSQSQLQHHKRHQSLHPSSLWETAASHFLDHLALRRPQLRAAPTNHRAIGRTAVGCGARPKPGYSR